MRERYLDIVKGIGILCIMLLHYENGVFSHKLNTFIGSFMITIFFVVAGWIKAMSSTTQRSSKMILKKRLRQLCIPYLYWSAIILIWDIVLVIGGYYELNSIGHDIYKTITLRGIGTLWFLPALLGGELIWNWFLRKNIYIWICFILLCIIYQYLYHGYFDNRVELIFRIIDAPFRVISNILNAAISIMFGYSSYVLFKKYLNKRGYLIVCGSILCVVAYLTANYLPSELMFIWFLFAPLLGPLGILYLVKSYQHIKYLSFFNFLGKNSLSIMVTHYSITLVLFELVITNYFKLDFDGWITIVAFIASIPIQGVISIVLNRYAKVLIGK